MLTLGNVTNFAQQAADQHRFLADSIRSRCPETVATLGTLQQRPIPQHPPALIPGPFGATQDQGLVDDMVQARQTQNISKLMLRACSAEAGEGVYPPFVQGR
jgi:hypothetical protein